MIYGQGLGRYGQFNVCDLEMTLKGHPEGPKVIEDSDPC